MTTTTTTTTPRLDQLEVGTLFCAEFVRDSKNSDFENVLIMAQRGEDENRTVTLLARDGDSTYEYDVYRYNGRWVYGSSAQRFRVVEVLGRLG